MRWAILCGLLFAPPPVPEVPADTARRESLERMNDAVDAHAKHDFIAAERALLEAIKLDGGFAAPRINLGRLYFELERFDEAKNAFAAAVRPIDESDTKGIHYELGRVFVAQSEADGISIRDQRAHLARALEAFDHAVAEDPNDVRAHFQRGKALDRLDRPGPADQAYRRCIERRPDRTECFRGLAFLYIDYGFPNVALSVLDLSSQVSSTDAQAWLNFAVADLRLERHADVLKHAQKALTLDPELTRAHFLKGMAQVQLRQHDRALESLEIFLKNAGPDVPEGQRQIAEQTLSSLHDVL
jgi:tetratricopeptide (TPR) repeat protein